LGVERVLGTLDSNICIPVLKKRIPPAILNPETVIPKKEKTSLPRNVKIIKTTRAVNTPFSAICRLSLSLQCSTIDRNTGLNPMGFTKVNKDENARMKKVVNSFITYVPKHEFPIRKAHY